MIECLAMIFGLLLVPSMPLFRNTKATSDGYYNFSASENKRIKIDEVDHDSVRISFFR